VQVVDREQGAVDPDVAATEGVGALSNAEIGARLFIGDGT